MLAGGCYLAATFDYFLALHLAISPYVQLGSFVGETSMALWLLIVGVNEAAWRRSAQRACSSSDPG